MKKIKQQAFTLIELLVVIAVIGVLVAVILPNMIGVRERARDTSRKNDLTQLKTALRLYYNDYNAYPAVCGTKFCCDAPTGSASCGDSFTVVDEVYMKEIPADFTYTQPDGNDGFLLSIILENASDTDIAASATRCGISSPTENTFYVCED